MRTYQRFLILIYKIIENTGLLDVSFVNNLYVWTYFKYKKFLESRQLIKLCSFAMNGFDGRSILSNSIILDIGAHIGFFTSYAASCSHKVKILALEPEGKNSFIFEKINENLIQQGKVELIKKAAWKFDGQIPFHFNNTNTANNMFSSQSIHLVPAITIDSLILSHGSSVFLIKIDVQGYEFEVLQGALKNLKMFKPLLIVEIDANSLSSRNRNGVDLVNFLSSLGYKPWSVKNSKFFEVSELNLNKKCVDLLFKFFE